LEDGALDQAHGLVVAAGGRQTLRRVGGARKAA
jgi:hypothetical protein